MQIPGSFASSTSANHVRKLGFPARTSRNSSFGGADSSALRMTSKYISGLSNSGPGSTLRRKDRSMETVWGARPVYIAAASSDTASAPEPSLLPVLAAVAVASCGAFSFGYHLGVVNGPLGAIATDLGFASNAGLQGLVVSSSLAGAAVGSLGGAGLADSLGRRKAFLLDSIPLLAGALLCASATGLASMLAGRALVGIGIGLSSALVPLYISEVRAPWGLFFFLQLLVL